MNFRAATAALVEKHSKEMMNLIQEKRAEYITSEEGGGGSNGQTRGGGGGGAVL